MKVEIRYCLESYENEEEIDYDELNNSDKTLVNDIITESLNDFIEETKTSNNLDGDGILRYLMWKNGSATIEKNVIYIDICTDGYEESDVIDDISAELSDGYFNDCGDPYITLSIGKLI